MAARGCKNSKDNFCYVCGLFTDKGHRKTITPLLKKAYELYFDSKLDLCKSWAPGIFCSTCASILSGWLRNSATNTTMPFGVPMIWREPRNHTDDCYFCMTSIQGFSFKTRKLISYPNMRSVSKPLPHDPVMCPIPVCSSTRDCSVNEDQEENSSSSEDMNSDPNYQPDNEIHLIDQAELNDLVRDLALTKGQAEVLGSRLREYNLLAPGTCTSTFRSRHNDLASFFDMSDNISYCKDVDGLMLHLGHEHRAEEWRLFIDASKTSLKAVLLHNGNRFASVPVSYSAHMKETYDNMVLLLEKVRYSHHSWQICGDLKVIAILMGMQTGM